MAHYLVTGGAGFIGNNIVAELVSQGEQVRVLDNFSTGMRSNLERFESQVEIIEGDIRSYHIVQEAVCDVDYVLHQAALPSVPRSVRDPITTDEVIVHGTLNLLQAARHAGIKRMVYASSSSVYGENEELPKDETMPTRPISPYAIAKLAAEQYCQSFYRLYGFETVCLRYFNVFGPGQNERSQYAAVIARFVTAMLNENPITIYGDGYQSRDFTYVSNVVQANLLACTVPDIAGTVANAACGQRYTLNDLVETLACIVGVRPDVQYLPDRPGDVRHSQASIERARAILGFDPKIDFAEGLALTVEWFRQKQGKKLHALV